MAAGAIDARIRAFFESPSEALFRSLLRHAQRRMSLEPERPARPLRQSSEFPPDLSHPRGRDDACVLLALRLDEQDPGVSPFRAVVDRLFELYPGRVLSLRFHEWKQKLPEGVSLGVSLEELQAIAAVSGVASEPAFLALAWISLNCRFGPGYRGPRYDLPDDSQAAAWLDELEGAVPADTTPSGSNAGKRTATINAQMKDAIEADYERKGWSVRQWASYLRCAPSTVHSQPTWKELANLRAALKAERQLQAANRPHRRRRHPRH